MNESIFPGNELRARREELGFSVDEVYRRIRVPIYVIQSLETGDVQDLPEPCYTVGFLKTYCQFLEMGPNRFVDTYQACVRPTTRFLRRAVSTKHAPRPKWITDALTWAAVCMFIALSWFAYSVIVRPNANPDEQRAHAGTIDDLRVPASPLGERE